MDKEKFLTSGLLHRFVLGLTSPDEDRVVANFLNKYPELKDEVDRAQKHIRQYALKQGIAPKRDQLPPDKFVS